MGNRCVNTHRVNDAGVLLVVYYYSTQTALLVTSQFNYNHTTTLNFKLHQ